MEHKSFGTKCQKRLYWLQKEVVEDKVSKVTQEFVGRWARSIQEGVERHEKIPFWLAVMQVQAMLRDAGVEIETQEPL